MVRVNGRGQQILDPCIGTRMRILNGRILGDSVGHFTCHKWNGSSVADYMITSEELFPRFRYFRVHPFYDEISDHCLITAELQMKCKRQLNSEITLQPMPDKFVFDNFSINSYNVLMNSKESLEMINKASQIKHEDPKLQIELKLQALNNIMINSATKASVLCHRGINKKKKKQQQAK